MGAREFVGARDEPNGSRSGKLEIVIYRGVDECYREERKEGRKKEKEKNDEHRLVARKYIKSSSRRKQKVS